MKKKKICYVISKKYKDCPSNQASIKIVFSDLLHNSKENRIECESTHKRKIAERTLYLNYT